MSWMFLIKRHNRNLQALPCPRDLVSLKTYVSFPCDFTQHRLWNIQGFFYPRGFTVIQLSSDCKLLFLYPTHGVMKEELARVDVCCMISYSCFHISLTGSRKRSLEEDEDFGAMQVTAAQNGWALLIFSHVAQCTQLYFFFTFLMGLKM